MRRYPSILPVSDGGLAETGAKWTKSGPTGGTVITDPIDGQYSDPVRIVAFNPPLRYGCLRRAAVPENFVDHHALQRPSQLPLPLKGAA